MLFLNEGKFASISSESGRVFTNAFVYILSESLELKGDGGILEGNEKLLTLRPSDELMGRFTSGDISKSKFRKLYFEELSSQENQFLLYTIVRSFQERKYLPVFICSDEDWETGFMKMLGKYMTKKFGMKPIDRKEYAKEIKAAWKDAKKGNKKKKAVRKEFKRSVRSIIKDHVQLSIEGLEKLQDMEKKFSIHRIVILLNQAGNEEDQISRKSIVKAIELFSSRNKKSRKLVKACIEELGISKKSDRWGRKDAINMVIKLYNSLNPDTTNS